MLDPYARKKDRQKLLRNLKLLDLLVQILKTYNPKASDSKLQKQVCIAAYKVIEVYLQGNSRKNELYLSQFIPFFEKHIGLGLNTESMLIELVRDNIQIVSMYDEEEIKKLIGLLLADEEKDSRFLDYLGVLCVCDGKASVANQEFILKELLVKRGQELFWPTKVVEDKHHVQRVVYQHPKTGEWKMLSEIADKTAVKKKLVFTSPWRWLESQLDLFGKLAKGNNTKVIRAITEELKYITFEEALAGASDRELHPSVRAKYVSLIIVLFIDIGNNRSVLETLPNTFVYSEVVENPFAEQEGDSTLALTGERNPHFVQLRDWILRVVTDNATLECTEDKKEANFLLAQILGVLEILVKFGYYDNHKDIRDVTERLMSMLDGTNDKNPARVTPEEFRLRRRFKSTPANRAAFAVKVKIMKIFDFFFNYRVFLRLQRFIFSYRCLTGHADGSAAASRVHRGGKRDPSSAVFVEMGPPEMDDGRKPLLSSTGKRNVQTSHSPPQELRRLLDVDTQGIYHVSAVARDYLSEIAHETAFFESDGATVRDEVLIKILLDISQYEDDGLLVGSFQLLNRYFSSSSDIFQKAVDAQLLLTTESTEAQRVVITRVNEVRKMIRHELDTESIEKLEAVFKQLRKLCFMNESLGLPHYQNQRILLNHGILPEVLDLILHRFDDYKFEDESEVPADPSRESVESLFREALKFLTAFARGHRLVQEQLFMRLDSILSVPFAVASVASVVGEVFTNHHELCLKVKETHVQQIFKLVVTTPDPNVQAELLQALKAMTITRVDDIDLPIKRNQDFVMKYFSRNKEFFSHFLGDEGDEDAKRMDLLQSAKRTDPQLMLLLNIVDLLATCCRGRNIFVQSICQNIMSDDEVLKILTADRIEVARKQPFCSYLVWVYLDGDARASALTTQFSDELMVKFMRMSCQHMMDVQKKLEVASQQQQAVPIKYLRYSCLGDQSEGESTVAKSLPPGSLGYLLDGLLPLLRVYYWQLTRLISEVHDIMNLIRQVASALLTSVPVLLPYLKSKTEILLLREAVLVVTSLPEVDHYLNIPGQLREAVNVFIEEASSTKSNPIKQFESVYSQELKLNVDFNNYVQAFEQACNGQNTVQHQIGVAKKPICGLPYSDFEDSGMKVKGPLYLPLGQPFQNFVSCFAVRENNTPRVFPETKHLVHLLDISFTKLDDLTEAEQARQDILVIKCLQVLRAAVHNEIMRVDPEVKENHPKRYTLMVGNVIRVQDAIQAVGGNTVAKILPMLNHQNSAIVTEVFAFLSVLLHEGNRKVQKGCEFLCNRREGRFLSGVARNLDLSVAITRENRILLQQLTDRERDNNELIMRFKGDGADLHASLQVLADEDGSDSDSDSDNDAETDKREVKDITKGMEMKKITRAKEKVQVSRKDTKEALLHHNPLHPELALKVLGQICNGQNRVMQNFFREQPDSIANVNLVGKVATFLQQQHSEINQQNIELIQEVVETLLEMSVGNYYNQAVLFDCQIVDAFNRILQLPHTIDCNLTDVLQLKATTVDLLHTFVEETHRNAPKLALDVLKTLDTEALLDVLVFFHELRKHPLVKRERMDDNAERALLSTYHVLMSLASLDGISEETRGRISLPESDDPSEREEKLKEAWEYGEDHTRSVEVLYENLDGDGVLAKVHFTYNPSDKLPEELIEKVKWNVNRDSGENKVRDFLEWTKAIKREIEHTNRLRSHWYTRIFIAFPRVWHWMYILLSLLLNILVLVSWRDPAELTPENAELFSPRTKAAANFSIMLSPTVPLVYWWFGSILLYVLGGIHVLVTLKLIVAYFLANWSNFYIIPSFSISVCGKELSIDREESYTDVFLFGWKTIYFAVLLSCSVLSLAFWGYFYPVCLLHIVINNDILQRVLRSVTKNWKSLLWTLGLGLVVLYIYGAIAYAGYQSYYDDPESSSHCRTLFQCVVSVIRLGLIMGGGLVTNADGAFKDEALLVNFPLYIPRTVLDISFFIIVTTIGLGVIFGIIVDTFSELRDERYKAEADKSDYCFICNHPSHEFDRRSAGFSHHVQHDHNMWDYIYFSLWLDRVHSNDQNAVELYVSQQIKENSPRFFPLHKARCLQDEDDDTKVKLESLMANVQKIMDRFENEEKVLAKQIFLEEQEEWEQRQAGLTRI
jgi:inositol 1,4,5-triphosphate receptor type 1